MNRIYLDHNATTPVRAEALEAALPYMDRHFGNPSSVHWAGSEAREALEEAREDLALLVGAMPREIVFTSGGSESNNLALKGVLEAAGPERRHLVITAVEHASVFESAQHLERQGVQVTIVPADGAGIVAPGAIAQAITNDTVLVSAIHANNETGTMLPIGEIGRVCRDRGVVFHTDAVQVIGKLPVDLRDLPIDLLSMSGHKFGALKGIGALFVRGGTSLTGQIHGGPQEGRRRAGTENVAGAVSLGAAAGLAARGVSAHTEEMRRLRDRLWDGIQKSVPDVVQNGHPSSCLPNTLNVSFPGADGETVLVGLDLEGVAVSSGSACSTGSLEPSRVLLAMGLDERAALSSVRFSMGAGNTLEEIERTLALIAPVVERARRASAKAGATKRRVSE